MSESARRLIFGKLAGAGFKLNAVARFARLPDIRSVFFKNYADISEDSDFFGSSIFYYDYRGRVITEGYQSEITQIPRGNKCIWASIKLMSYGLWQDWYPSDISINNPQTDVVLTVVDADGGSRDLTITAQNALCSTSFERVHWGGASPFYDDNYEVSYKTLLTAYAAGELQNINRAMPNLPA